MNSYGRNLRHLAIAMALLLLSAATADAQQARYERMLLHDRRITTEDVVRVLVEQRATIIDSSSYFALVTIGIDSVAESRIREFPWVLALDPIPELTTFNDKSRTAIGVPNVHPAPYSSTTNDHNLTGTGVRVGIWDAMFPFAHTDYTSRVTVMEQQNCGGQNHATHVTGTVAGTGFLSSPSYHYAGMAPAAEVFSWSFVAANCTSVPPYAFQEAAPGVDNQGIVISQNSWGYLINANNCVLHGKYEIYAHSYDHLVRTKDLSVFFSNGNQRGSASTMSGCGFTPGAEYGTVAPPATAKNVVSIGATNHLGAMTSFSSWGPTKDGRLKPDCVADGYQINSTWLANGYGTMSGTSMSCPAASGSAALLVERYRQLNAGATPRPDVLKNIILNSCRDLGNAGPDYKHGYGMIDIPNAVRLIDDDRIHTGSVPTTGAIAQFTFEIVKSCPIKVMLVYTDVPGNPSASIALVNDLDLELVDPTGLVTHYPLTLDKNNPGALAVSMPNHLDNVEQVVVASPTPGTWTVRVIGTNVDATTGAQPFAVTWLDDCADLFIKDSPADVGIEPNTQTGPVIWASDDIWVRNQPDGLANQHQHENPKYGQTNFIYVKVRNRGNQTGSGLVHLNWAKAGTALTWPGAWDGSTPCCGTNQCGGEPSPAVAVIVPPGGEQIVQFTWSPPDPLSFTSCYPTEDHHFCLVARVETSSTAPFEMSYPEIGDIGWNTTYNNNVAWKNVSVVDIFGSVNDVGTGVLLRGDPRTAADISLRFRSPVDAAHESFYRYGTATLHLGEKLYTLWSRAGSQGFVDGTDERAHTVRLSHEDAWLGGIRLDSNQIEPISLTFDFDKKRPADSAAFLFDLIQFTGNGDSARIDGGERFVLRYHATSKVSTDGEGREQESRLSQNTPNPVERETSIEFTIGRGGSVRLVLCDMMGREIRTLAEGEYEPGVHTVRCLLDDLASGSYLYKLITDDGTHTRSLVVLR